MATSGGLQHPDGLVPEHNLSNPLGGSAGVRTRGWESCGPMTCGWNSLLEHQLVGIREPQARAVGFLLPEKRGPAGPSTPLLCWSSRPLWA